MDSSREDEDKVENRIWEFRLNEISPIRNGSFGTRENIEFKIIMFAKIFILFLGWNIWSLRDIRAQKI